MSLRVLEPGLCSLIVDGGRPRTRSLGVPVGGAADRSAFALGNALLGNLADSAALEITLAGPVIQALSSVGMVLLGSPFSLGSARQRLTCNQSVTLEEGEELHIGGTPHGTRAYLCVVGGFQLPEILGSRSALSPLKRGDELPCTASAMPRRAIQERFGFWQVPALSSQLRGKERILRILPGPEAEWFAQGGRELYSSTKPTFTVLADSNRMGLRLSGEPLTVPPREMVSQPVSAGAIQVTRGGQLILLGVDGQSIGGYPRIGYVISADMDIVGQLRPGDQVQFEPVALEEAEQLNREKSVLLDSWCIRLRQAATMI